MLHQQPGRGRVGLRPEVRPGDGRLADDAYARVARLQGGPEPVQPLPGHEERGVVADHVDLAPGDAQVDTVQRADAAERLGDALHADGVGTDIRARVRGHDCIHGLSCWLPALSSCSC